MSPEDIRPDEVQDLRDTLQQYEAELTAMERQKPKSEAEFFQQQEGKRLLSGYVRDTRGRLAQLGVGETPANPQQNEAGTSHAKSVDVSDDAINAKLRELLTLQRHGVPRPQFRPPSPGGAANDASPSNFQQQEQAILNGARSLYAKQQAESQKLGRSFRSACRR